MSKPDNKLFYLCSLIEHMGRESKNKRADVIKKLGRDNIQRIYDYSDVFHCEPIEAVSAQWLERCGIEPGVFDNISVCRYRLPSFWDIGKVYCRLIQSLGGDTIETFYDVYSSWITRNIDDYNVAVYYMSPEYLCESYKEGVLLEY